MITSAATAPGRASFYGHTIFIALERCPVCHRLYAEHSTEDGVSKYVRHALDDGSEGGVCLFKGDRERALRRQRGVLRALRRRRIQRLPLPMSLR